ncbi:MAG: hypothetical protein FJ104_02400, partial [Deltaproteobacteria bacterium]|nr:hypothetical protein [Deltaproteobacteria bacterium]
MTAPSPPPTAPAGDAAVALDVVFVQFDRRKYEGALERLLSLLDRLPVRSRVVVVDNAHPGDPARAVTARLVHLGGDNSSWEFSGFDRGLAYLDSLPEPAPVVALATDAFRAYGEHFLSLVTPAALAAARDLRAAVGWVDAWPTETTL